MADPKGPERETSGASPGARPKAPPLDLSATDVTPKTSAPTSAPAKPAAAEAKDAAEKGPAEKSAETKNAPKPAATPAPSQTAARDPKLDTAPTAAGAAAASAAPTGTSSSAASSAAPASGGAASTAAGAKPAGSVPPTSATAKPSSAAAASVPPGRTQSSGGVGLLGAGLAGLIGAALAIALVFLFGRDLLGTAQPDMSRVAATESKLDAVGRDLAALRERPAPTFDTGALDARIAELGKAVEGSGARSEALESEVRALATRAPAVQVDTGAVDALGQRLDALDAQVKDAAKAGDVAQVTEAIEGLRGRIDTSIAAGLKPLEDKVAALEAELKARPVGDPAARLVVALGAVDQAFGAGRPFANELAAVKAAGGDVAGLEAAAAGAPTTAALASELKAIMAGLPPLRAAQDASVFQRFVANAGSIVKVTPAEAPAGGGPSEARLRVAAKAEAGDVAGALADRAGLDDAAKAATEAWAQKAQARIAAGEALISARTAALARLGSN